MKFIKYQHIERFGSEEVLNIELGTCYIFPKIDGTNSSVWLDNGEIKAGSRNRELSEEKDNANFYKTILKDERIKNFFEKYPKHRLFGEWLVPHSLKTYRNDAWKKFYVFDVCLDKEEDTLKYLHYEEYKKILEEFNLDYIPPIKIIKNADYEKFIEQLDKNIFLIENGKGFGEGIVVKNYDYFNKYGRQTWAKIITSEFKEQHCKKMGAPLKEYKMIEQQIIDDFMTEALIDKEYHKIVNEKEGWKSEYIPMLLGKLWYCLINEEMWNILSKYKLATINFKTLRSLMNIKIKETKSNLF